jgi:hypothetical protein
VLIDKAAPVLDGRAVNGAGQHGASQCIPARCAVLYRLLAHNHARDRIGDFAANVRPAAGSRPRLCSDRAGTVSFSTRALSAAVACLPEQVVAQDFAPITHKPAEGLNKQAIPLRNHSVSDSQIRAAVAGWTPLRTNNVSRPHHDTCSCTHL